MPPYYFDLRDGDELAVDEEGAEMANLPAVQMEAARSLVDMAGHATWTKADSVFGHPMAVEVRDENGLVLQGKCVSDNRTGSNGLMPRQVPGLHKFTFIHLARN